MNNRADGYKYWQWHLFVGLWTGCLLFWPPVLPAETEPEQTMEWQCPPGQTMEWQCPNSVADTAAKLKRSRQEVFTAQQAHAQYKEYCSQWWTGRLLKCQGDVGGAILAYRQAAAALQFVQPDSGKSFRETVGDMYLERADLLLQEAAKTDNTSPCEDKLRLALLKTIKTDEKQSCKQALLKEAQETIEQLKTAELEDYFGDECFLPLKTSSVLEQLQDKKLQADQDVIDDINHTAIIYPIILKDRMEILLYLPSQSRSQSSLKQYTVKVERNTLEKTVTEFRKLIDQTSGWDEPGKKEYIKLAHQLYKWLIPPLPNAINTLVIIPDGPLRTIPIASLCNDNDLLIEKYAVATVPSLQLTKLEKRRQAMVMLCNGLPEKLKHTKNELDYCKNCYGATILEDKNLTRDKLKQELNAKSYNIVHIASHAEFKGKVDKSFILMHAREHLQMSDLENLMTPVQDRGQTIDLLTLSACVTAKGDDTERAALGLAGIAINAGARSALGSLWNVDDEKTAELIIEFYRQLRNSKVSKAEALRRAQLNLLTGSYKKLPNNSNKDDCTQFELLEDKQEHEPLHLCGPNRLYLEPFYYLAPFYWSPFILIGNWR